MIGYAVVILLACLLIMLMGGLVGVGAAYLARREGATYPAALRQGCTAFASTLLVITALVSAFGSALPR